MSKEYCIAHHDAEMCSVPNCRFHILLLGNILKLLQKMDPLCIKTQHVDCLYTLFEHRFSGNINAKSGQVFDNVQRAVKFKQRNRGVDRLPSIAKRILLKRKYGKYLLRSFQKTKSKQTSGSVFAEEIE